MSKDYKFEHLLICDDIRREANGKEIIIGLYTEDIVCSSLPTTIPMLTFRIFLSLTKPLTANFELNVKAPNNQIILHAEGQANSGVGQKHAVLVFPFIPVQFSSAGEYSVFFAVDKREQKVATFNVVQGPVQA